MADFYDAADLFLNGSNIDNTPLSILGAFAAGVRVATADAGGIPYVVTDAATGLVTSLEDEKGHGGSGAAPAA
jgi:glycosyltransferase involved in cell wall biosynthesis